MTTSISGVFRTYDRLLSPQGRQALRVMSALAALTGLVKGGALLMMLAFATALAKGSALGWTPVTWLFALAVLAILGATISYLQTMVTLEAAFDIMRNSHVALGDHIAKLPLGWFRSSVTGSLSRVATQGMMEVGQGVAHMLDKFISNSAALIVILIGTLAWQPGLGLVLLITVPLYFIVLGFGGRAILAIKQFTHPPKIELADRLVEFARCQPAIRASGRSRAFAPLTAAVSAEERASRRGLLAQSCVNLVFGTLGQAVVFTLILVAGKLALAGELGPIETITFVGISLALMQIITNMGDQLIGFHDQAPVLAVIEEVLDSPILPVPAHPKLPNQPGRVEVENVSFGYDGGTPVLRGVSFTAPPHTMTALVGHSGSGKTTVTKLIARFYDTTSGAIRVGGVDVREQSTADLMAQLAMVFQDVYLFDDTLRANVRVGRPEATEAEVDEAAAVAGVTEIAARLPGGWNARVGEGGAALSGGERQRVSIARALLKDAPVVLFDEATSALDAENEANIVAAFGQLQERSTVVAIAHKLDTILRADQIVVLNPDGSLNATGTHRDLIGSPGVYRDFWDARTAAAGWTLAGTSRATHDIARQDRG